MNTTVILLLVALTFASFGFVLGIIFGIEIGKRIQIRLPRSKAWWILGASIAALLLIYSITLTINSAIFVSNSSKTNATIVDLTQTQEDLSYPVYEYEVAGKLYKSTSTITSDYNVGDVLAIRYHRDHPEKSKLEWEGIWAAPIITTFLSLVFSVCATWQFFARKIELRAISKLSN